VQVYESLEALRDDLAVNMTLTHTPPRGFQIRYEGQDKEAGRFLLESLTRAFVVYQEEQARAAGQASKTEITQPAIREPDPVEDKRLEVAGISFAASMGGALLLWIIARLVLRQSASLVQRETAQVAGALQDPDQWPEPVADQEDSATVYRDITID